VSVDRSSRLRMRLDALTEAQRRALAERLASEGKARASERLVGFVVLDSAGAPTDDALRAFLAERVPEHMVPSRFVVLDQLPRTAAGKLDRHALQHVAGAEVTATTPGRPAVAPRTETEARLAAIWKDVLKLDDIGVDDDFFEIGGDSLLSIRVIARAGREGIRIAPERFFERPTIALLAATHDGNNGRGVAERSRASLVAPVGDAPLTPIQHWFFDAIPRHRDWWNQSYLLEIGHALDAAQIGTIVLELINHHDALRLRIICRDGYSRQEVPAPVAVPPCRVVDLHSVPSAELTTRVAEECEREQASLRLEDGNLFRCVVFEGDTGWRRILLLGHHLVLDSVSWSVILEDLATLVTQAADGEPLRLPEKTAPARAWAIALGEHAGTPAISTSAAHWAAMPADPSPMPVDAPDVAERDGPDSLAGCNRDAAMLTLTLGAEESRRLLQDAVRRLDASVQTVLLAALLIAWRQWSGSDSLRLDLEGHGRDVLGDTLDVSRTVGWFTTVFPIHLSVPRDRGNGAEPSVAAVVDAVRGALGALPLRGAAHGLARYLAPDESTRVLLAAQPRSAVLFNHLGTHDLTLPSSARLRVTNEPQGQTRSPDAPRAYLLEINSRVERGQLIVTIDYSRRAHSATTIERFADALRSALDGVALGSAVAGLPGVDAASLAIVADLLAELDDA
jgi:non-ribosomal peptide synthase protein (TIGR01720 family)